MMAMVGAVIVAVCIFSALVCINAQSATAILQGLDNPAAVTVDSAGSIYIVDAAVAIVLRVEDNGSFQSFSVPFSDPRFIPTIRLDSFNNVYVGGDNQTIYKFSPNGTLLASIYVQTYAGEFVVDSSGTLIYVVDNYFDQSRIIQFSSDGRRLNYFYINSTFYGFCAAIAIDSSNDVYALTYYSPQAIFKFSSDGIHVGLSFLASTDLPAYRIAIDRANTLYFRSYYSNELFRILANGTRLPDLYAAIPVERFNQFALDQAGNIYVTDGDNSRVLVFSSSGLLIKTVTGSIGSVRYPVGAACT